MGTYDLAGSLTSAGYYPVRFCNGNTGYVSKAQYDNDVATGNYGCSQGTTGSTTTAMTTYVTVRFQDGFQGAYVVSNPAQIDLRYSTIVSQQPDTRALDQIAALNADALSHAVATQPPSPPSLSTSTVNASTGNFSLSGITSSGTTSIDLSVQYPNGTGFIFFATVPLANFAAGYPIHLPLSANGAPYGTYQFQAVAKNSAGQASSPSNIASITVTNPTPNHSVTLKTLGNAQNTFVISFTDDQNLASVLGTGITVVSDTITTTAVNSTLTSIGSWIAANPYNAPPPAATPAPTGLTSTVNQDTVSLSWSSQYPVTIFMGNAQLVTGYAANSYSRIGVAAGTYTFDVFATNPTTNLDSTHVQTTATVTYTGINPTPTPTATNYAYDIQIPNVTQALRLVTITNYGITPTIQFPAKSFTENLLMASFPAIPTTLTARFINYVSDTPNDMSVATYLSTHFTPGTIPPPSSGGFPEIQGNKFTSLITLLGAIFLFKK